MRKAKIVNIEGLGEVTVKEISPFAVYQALNSKNTMDELRAIALDCISLSPEKMEKLYPSEIEALVDAFMEVNSSFLAISGKLGLKQAMDSIKDAMVSEISTALPKVFADSYKQVMATPGITVGAAS
ncbi:MAG: hypothetical protein ACOYB1_18695 [Limnohabitans sp.]